MPTPIPVDALGLTRRTTTLFANPDTLTDPFTDLLVSAPAPENGSGPGRTPEDTFETGELA
jgi:hypothetical protein